MSRNKRLFLLAGYNKKGIIDDALVFYIKSLSKYGDVILCMDSDCSAPELSKITPYTITAFGTRHGEYDFGSYKRAYQYALEHDILNDYDFVYMANDSVYGPLHDIAPILKQMESQNTDACGLIKSIHKTHSFMESWFVCINKKIATSTWFNEFMSNITRQTNKCAITILYEHGLSNLIKNNNCSWSGLYHVYGRATYNNPKRLFKSGCPFIKKMSFTRHNGAIGHQLYYVLSHCDKTARDAVISSANATYTREYISWLLTPNPFAPIIRGIKYAIQKFWGK